jgi:DNA-binding CsgD family transcriptional regulator
MTTEEARVLLMRLTEKELEALKVAAEGARCKQSGDLCSLSDRGVQYRRGQLTRKLGVNMYRACWILGRSGV